MSPLVFGLLALAGVALFGWYLWVTRMDAQRERLMAGVFDADELDVSLWKDAADLLQLTALQRLLSRSPFARALQQRLHRSGLRTTLAGAVLLATVSAVVAAGIALLSTKRPDWAVAAFLIVLLLAWFALAELAARRVRALELQLPAFVTQMITTLGGGGTALSAVRNAARNAPPPLGPTMQELVRKLELGVASVQAWRDWADGWNSPACRLLSTAVRMKWDAGGEMSTMLGYVLDRLESRRRMELRVDTLTSQARLSTLVLISLPFVIGFITYSFNPELFHEMLADPIGRRALMIAGGLMLLGFLWLRRIARLES
jgi:tight adherence protein B